MKRFCKLYLLSAALLIFCLNLCLTGCQKKETFGGFLYPIKEQGLYGYIDSIGNRVIEPQYLWASIYKNGLALAVVDTIYKEYKDSVAFDAGEDEKLTLKNALFIKYGFINKSGDFVISPELQCVIVVPEKGFKVEDLEECTHILNRYTFSCKRALAYDTISWKQGYIDTSGQWVIPAKYSYARKFSNGYAVAYSKVAKPLYTNGACITKTKLRCAYIDVSGKPLTKFKYENLTDFSCNRGVGTLKTVSKEESGIEFYGEPNLLINEKGEEIDSLNFMWSFYPFSKAGICAAQQKWMFTRLFNENAPARFAFFNSKGELLEPLKGLSDGQIEVYNTRKDIMGSIPEDVFFTDVTNFDDGLAGVTADDEHWFIIDKYMIIHGYGDQSVYEKVKGFNNGLCAVKKDGKWGYINNKIKEIIPCKYDSCGRAYPYLEEVFDLNSEGEIKGKKLINKKDSVVWFNDAINKFDNKINKYAQKDKKDYGKWIYIPDTTSSSVTLYVIGILVLLSGVVILVKKRNKKINTDMVNLSLWKRFIASILDKVCIIILWVVLLNYVAYTPYTASGKLGTYSYLITIPPSNYEYIDIGNKNRQGVSENNYGVSEGYRALQELDLASMKPETTKDTDIKITFWFILANLIYFMLGELLCGASFFKRIFGGVIVEDDGSECEKSRLLVRNFAFGIILTLCILIHFLLNISYLLIVIAFFVMFEFPLFRNRQNCLDKLFGHYLVKKSSLNREIAFSASHDVSLQVEDSDIIQESEEKHEYSSYKLQSSLPTNNVIEEQQPHIAQDVVLNNSGITTEKKDMPIKQENKNTKSNKGKFKLTTGIMLVLGMVALYSAHQMVSYFLADYYNPSNYYFDDNSYAHITTKNLQRKHQLSRNLISYENERILSSVSLGDTVSSQQWLDKDLGNLPSGKYISSYYGTREDYYYAGNRTVTRYYSERVPHYRTVDYGYGIKDRYQDGWDYTSVPYTDWEPVYKSHYWSYALSSFDISDQVSFFENEDSTYSDYLRNIEAQINANYDFKNHYTKVGGLKAFAYYTTNGLPIKRVIFCANKRAYILEVKSTYHIDKHSGEIAGILNLKGYNVNQKDKNTLIAYFLCFVVCCSIIFIYYNRNRKKDTVLNKYSNRLCMCAIAAAGINCIIFAVQLYCLFTSYAVNFNAAIVLVLSSFCVLLVDLPLCRYYYKKSRCDYHYDYILPEFIKKFVYNKISNEVNKKLYLTFVGYPMMVLLLIPMGLVILPYIVISLIVSTLAVYISKWTAWIGASNEKSNSDQINIVNYYSVLGVSKTSNQNDINIAYNAIMAKINMSLNTSSFDPAYFAQVQEAFFVLGDSENARTIYDEELMSFESCTNPATYVIKNVVLLDMIRNYRQNNKTNPQKTKSNELFNRMFFIITVGIFIVIAIVKCSSDDNSQNLLSTKPTPYFSMDKKNGNGKQGIGRSYFKRSFRERSNRFRR